MDRKELEREQDLVLMILTLRQDSHSLCKSRAFSRILFIVKIHRDSMSGRKGTVFCIRGMRRACNQSGGLGRSFEHVVHPNEKPLVQRLRNGYGYAQFESPNRVILTAYPPLRSIPHPSQTAQSSPYAGTYPLHRQLPQRYGACPIVLAPSPFGLHPCLPSLQVLQH